GSGVAAGAGPAVIGGQRRRRELEVREQLGQEEVRAGGAVEQQRVLADPAEAGAHRPLALEHRARVDVALEARAREGGGEARGERAQERAHARVVVRAERVGGDPAGERRAPVAWGRRRRAVGVGEGDDGARPRPRRARVDALRCAPCQVAHLAGAALRQPRLEERAHGERRERRRAGAGEAQRPRRGRDRRLARTHAAPWLARRARGRQAAPQGAAPQRKPTPSEFWLRVSAGPPAAACPGSARRARQRGTCLAPLHTPCGGYAVRDGVVPWCWWWWQRRCGRPGRR